MSLTLRCATFHDADAVATVLCAARNEFLPYAPMTHSPQEVRAWIREVLIPAGGVSVAAQEDKVVAMLAVSRRDDASWIDQFYLLPGWTGQGIGTQLLLAAHRLLRPPIRLLTFQENRAARRFYERHGYRAISFSNGSGNEERCPDVLYEWPNAEDAGPGT